jgi:hypothetical protein
MILGVVVVLVTERLMLRQRVLEKAGLSYLRTVHLDWPDPLPGNEHGDVEYQLLRDDWAPS